MASRILLGILAVVFVAILQVTFSTDAELFDALSFYSAGKVSRGQGFAAAYDVPLVCAEQARLAPEHRDREHCLTFYHPPIILPVWVLLSRFDYGFARIVFALLMLGSLALCTVPLRRLGLSRVATFSLLLLPPLAVSLAQGQETAIVLLGLLLWLEAVSKNSDREAGFSLAIALVKPHFALAVALAHLWARRRVFMWFAVGAACVSAYCLLLVGFEGVVDFALSVIAGAGGEQYGVNPKRMYNILGLLLRLGVAPSSAKVVTWSIFAIGIAASSLLLRRPGVGCAGAVIFITIITAPHLHAHDLGLLAAPLAALISRRRVSSSLPEPKARPTNQ